MVWLLVGAGGALGSMARHALNGVVQRRELGAVFPYGIFLINVTGSAIIGLVAGLVAGERVPLSNDARTFLVVGVLGGFTTFSSFSLDTLTLARGGHGLLAVVNAAGQVVCGFVAAWLGFRLGLAV